MSSSAPIVIEAGRPLRHYWRDLWSHRELFYFLAWRDILVRYKQTLIGIAWSGLRPLLTMVILTVVFGKLANLPSAGGAPYPVFVFIGLLPWQFFCNCVSDTSNSLIENANMLTKIYFPRLIVPLSIVIVSILDFIIACVILAGLMLWFAFVPNWRVITIPIFFSLAVFISIGVGVWLAALNVRYRDFRFVVPFLIQVGTYLSPVGFTSSIVPGRWRWVYSLNPMVGVIDGFRWAILGPTFNLYLPSLGISVVVAAVLFTLSVSYFRKTERALADIV